MSISPITNSKQVELRLEQVQHGLLDRAGSHQVEDLDVPSLPDSAQPADTLLDLRMGFQGKSKLHRAWANCRFTTFAARFGRDQEPGRASELVDRRFLGHARQSAVK